MKTNKKIDYSIIIPAYNEEEYLPVTLASVKHSMDTLGQFEGEIIVTDNNSTDRTALVAKESGARVIFEEHLKTARVCVQRQLWSFLISSG
jgi:glycosyltransferase involved in cell wall biosynthesis